MGNAGEGKVLKKAAAPPGGGAAFGVEAED